jgi:hypothetical protein
MTANNKIQPTKVSVDGYIGSLTDVERKRDVNLLLDHMKECINSQPVMWGSSIVGFGTHHYVHESGRTGDMAAVGFSTRKQALTIYGLRTDKNTPLIEKLAFSQESKGCIYIKNMLEVELTILKEVITNAYGERNN